MKLLEKLSKLLTVLFLALVVGMIVLIKTDRTIGSWFVSLFAITTLSYILVLGTLSIHTIYKEYKVDKKSTINKFISKFLTMFIIVTMIGYLVNRTANIKYNIAFALAMALLSFYRDAKMKM